MTIHAALAIRIPHGDQETPTSFASRLSTLHGCTAFNVFCLDMGTTAYDVVHGRDRALARLEGLGGLPSGRLLPFSIRRTDDGFVLNGQALRKQSLRRERIHVCPLCIADDLGTQPGPVEVRPYARASWSLASIRSCARHRAALIPLEECLPGMRLGGVRAYDFAQVMWSAAGILDGIGGYAVERTESPFETYLLRRLWGPKVEIPFLDALPWYAAARSCEMVGAVALAGARCRTGGMSERAWFDAGIEGFRILADGEDAFRELLDRLQASFKATRQNWGPRSMFGRLYEWLAHEDGDEAYDRLREIMKRHMIETLPLGPGDEVFGEIITVRRLHSVRTAAQETGRHPKRLRKLLLEAGVIGEAELGLTDDRILFQADLVGGWLEQAAGAMPLTKAGEYLNAPRVQVRKLYDCGLIRPFAEGGRHAHLKDHAFSREELDAFLGRLLADAETVPSPPQGAADIPAAAKQACCSAEEIVRLVLDRGLSWTGRLRDVPGYLSLLVDVGEVRERVRWEDHGGYSLREVERLLATSTHGVLALVGDGHLPARTAVNPVNRCPQTVIPRESLDTFRETFVSLAEMSRERAVNPRGLLRELREAGVAPAIVSGDAKKSYFFRRTELPPHH
ncbi:TniQ family protein [Microvirga sp. GCM10011540]|uniref:TniQ family protein n=1 Tax=Microvirga sp. GCM10011540 TaxID=3317338 RepID=UPI00361F6F6E